MSKQSKQVLLRGTSKLIRNKQTIDEKPIASLSAQALNKKTEQTNDEQTNETQSVAISGVTLVQDRADAFVAQWSDETIADIEQGWIADEKRRRNALELMFDMRQDYSDNPEALMELPAPYTEAPKGMTPHKWQAEQRNTAWPFDKWSERVTQSQGGKRNVNYSFYLIAFDRSKDGVAINQTITQLKDMIANYGKSALTGDYQGMEKDQLQTELSKYEARRTTAGENIRKAIGLHRAFTQWDSYAVELVKTGKGPWKYPSFSVALNAEGTEPVSSKKPIRFAITELTRDANGKEREAVTYKPPISVDTFLNYDVDLFGAAVKQPGADVYNAVVESAKVETDNNKPQAIKLPFSKESWIAAAGLFAGFIETDENRAAVLKRLMEKDANNKFKNEAEIKSVVDLYLELVPVYQSLKKVYEKMTLSDSEAAKLERASN